MQDRKSGVEGKGVKLGGRRISKKRCWARVEAAATTSAIPARKNCLRYGVKKGIKPLKAARLPFFSSRLLPVSEEGAGLAAVLLVLPVSVLVVIVFRFDLHIRWC